MVFFFTSVSEAVDKVANDVVGTGALWATLNPLIQSVRFVV